MCVPCSQHAHMRNSTRVCALLTAYAHEEQDTTSRHKRKPAPVLVHVCMHVCMCARKCIRHHMTHEPCVAHPSRPCYPRAGAAQPCCLSVISSRSCSVPATSLQRMGQA